MKLRSAPLKYQHIRTELVSSIRAGTYQTGDKLPSESDLADSFNASRSTVIRALRSVEEQGLIERRQGSGSFVTRKATQDTGKRSALGLLKAVQSGRYPDSVVDQLQTALSMSLQRRGSALIVHAIEADDEPAAIAHNMIGQRVAGVFVVPMPPWFPRQSNQELVDVLARSGQSVVLLDGDLSPRPRRSGFDVVGTDNRHCGYLQAEHLLKLGLKRILFLGISPLSATVAERLLGYREAMSNYGIDVPPEWICDLTGDHVEAGFVAEMIRSNRPEGIVCKSDESAALLMHHLPSLGIQVPRDLKIVGFDDRPIGSLLPVKLTTIRQPIAEIAENALQLMELRASHPERAASYMQLAGELIVRESSMNGVLVS